MAGSQNIKIFKKGSAHISYNHSITRPFSPLSPLSNSRYIPLGISQLGQTKKHGSEMIFRILAKKNYDLLGHVHKFVT